jgi:hypothetical protein
VNSSLQVGGGLANTPLERAPLLSKKGTTVNIFKTLTSRMAQVEARIWPLTVLCVPNSLDSGWPLGGRQKRLLVCKVNPVIGCSV